MVRGRFARIAPAVNTKTLWNVGSVNAIESAIRIGSAAVGKHRPDFFPVQDTTSKTLIELERRFETDEAC